MKKSSFWSLGLCLMLIGCSGGGQDGDCIEGQSRCSGTVMQSCSAGKWKDVIDCQSIDWTCEVTDDGSECVGPPCLDDETRCAGNTIQTCSAGVWQITEDCSLQSNGFCIDEDGPVCRVGCSDGNQTCVGSSLHTCVSNEFQETLDCDDTDQKCTAIIDVMFSARCYDPEIEWVSLKAGSFMMGSDEDLSEAPVHEVTLTDFEITRTEVTIFQYKSCVRARACTEPVVGGVECPDGNFESSEFNALPVHCVTFDQASEFCEWSRGRLPSEAEWEYASRSSGLENTYPWGEEVATCEYANMSDCQTKARVGLWAVASRPEGNTDNDLFDLSGNAREWVQDWHHDTYEDAPKDGTAWEIPSGSKRVVRGGSFKSGALEVRTSSRSAASENDISDDLGFRCVR